MAQLIVIRGPIGAGKSSVMHEVVNRLPNSSAIEVDAIKRMIDPNGSTDWRREVAVENSALLATALLARNRSVVTETHARWPEQTERFRTAAEEVPDAAFSSFLLTAPFDVCLSRARGRHVPGIGYAIDKTMVSAYYTNLEPFRGELTFDTSHSHPAETAERIINSLPAMAGA